MLLDWTKVSTRNFDPNFQHSITASKLFRFTPLDVWRIRTELFILISSLTKMFENDRIQVCCDVPNSAGVSLRLPDVLNYSFLWAIIERGDIIEYIPQSTDMNSDKYPSHFIQRAVVIGIRAELDGKTHTVILNNGDTLIHSLHMVRRVAGMDPFTKEPIWNPLREWKNLSEFHMTPTEDAADGPDRPVNIRLDTSPEKHIPDPKRIQKIRNTDMRARRKRKCDTKNYHRSLFKSRQEHTGHIDNNQRSSFLSWLNPSKVPGEILFLNRLYRVCLEIGNTTKFFELIKSTTESMYQARKKHLDRDVFSIRTRTSYIALKIMFAVAFFQSFINANGVQEFIPGIQKDKEQATSQKEMKRIEGTLKFEHDVKHLKIQKCPICMENHMNEVDSTYDPNEPYKCISCTNADIPDTFYHDKKLLPIWYERKPNATDFDDYLLNENNQKIIRYDIPRELSILTISEQLLIRKCAPFIPSIHLSHGYYALTGQCVAFRQDLTDVCTDLPRLPSEIVTFIRQMGNSETTAVHLSHLKVRKKVVLDALKWLKLHHCGYRHITISESKLDWIGESGSTSMFGQIRNIRVNGKQVSRSQKPAVSQVQCMEPVIDAPQLDFTTVGFNGSELGTNPVQLELMDELVDTAISTKQKGKLLMFPQHGDEPLK